MKAVRLHGHGGIENLIYEDVSDPVADPGQVVVKIAACSVNPLDYKVRSGVMAAVMQSPLPMILGMDIAGTVDQIPETTRTNLQLGDRVFGHLPINKAGAYAEKAAIEAGHLAAIPDGLSFEQAACLPIVGLTAAQAVEQVLRPTAGDKVLVSGALGSIGRIIIHYLRRADVQATAAVRASRLDQARELGLNAVSLSDSAALDAAGPFDAVIDVVGGTVGEGLLKYLASPGVFVSINYPPPSAPADSGVEVRQVGVIADAKMLEELGRSMANGELAIPIVRTLPLSQAGEAQLIAERDGSKGKVVLTA